MANQTNSMAHTKWMCKYKGVEIIEGHLMPDHIHMLVSIPPKYSISQFMGYLKGKSALTGISLLTFVTVHALRKQ